MSGLILCISECLWFGDVCGITRGQIVAFFPPPKGGLGCLMSPPCLESQGCHLIQLYYLLSCFSFLSLLLFLSYLFFCLLVYSPELFPENFSIFFVKRYAFLYGFCSAARRSKLVGGMCSVRPYGTSISFLFIYVVFFFF